MTKIPDRSGVWGQGFVVEVHHWRRGSRFKARQMLKMEYLSGNVLIGMGREEVQWVWDRAL